MDWKDISSAVAAGAPMLGSLLLGKPGEMIGTLISTALGVPNTPADVNEALRTNPEAFVILRRVELENATKLREIAADLSKAEIGADSSNAAAVNSTMQAEAASEKWPAYSWRPFIGFAFGFNLVCSGLMVLAVFLPLMFGSQNMAAAMLNLPTALGALAAINGTALPILGIASWYRGKMQADPAIPPAVKDSTIK